MEVVTKKTILSVVLLALFALPATAADYIYNCQIDSVSGTSPRAQRRAELTHPRWEFGFAFIMEEGKPARLRKLEVPGHYDGVGSDELFFPEAAEICEIKDWVAGKTYRVPTLKKETCFDDLRSGGGNGREGGWVLVVPNSILNSKNDTGVIKVVDFFDTENGKDTFSSSNYRCRAIN